MWPTAKMIEIRSWSLLHRIRQGRHEPMHDNGLGNERRFEEACRTYHSRRCTTDPAKGQNCWWCRRLAEPFQAALGTATSRPCGTRCRQRREVAPPGPTASLFKPSLITIPCRALVLACRLALSLAPMFGQWNYAAAPRASEPIYGSLQNLHWESKVGLSHRDWERAPWVLTFPGHSSSDWDSNHLSSHAYIPHWRLGWTMGLLWCRAWCLSWFSSTPQNSIPVMPFDAAAEEVAMKTLDVGLGWILKQMESTCDSF